MTLTNQALSSAADKDLELSKQVCREAVNPSLEVITIFFRTTFKPFLSICRFYRLFLYF